MADLRKSRIMRIVPILFAVCLISLRAQAKYGSGSGAVGSAETSTYLFVGG